MITTLQDFYSGDSIDFDFINKKYSTTEYTLDIKLVNATQNLIFTTDIINNQFKFFQFDTSTIPSGKYKVYAEYKKLNFKKTEFINFLEVKPQAGVEDIVSYNKKMLDAIEDLLFKRTENDYSSYTIGNRSIVKMMPDSLLKWRNYFFDLVNQEEMIKDGKKNRLKIRWVGRFGGQ